MNKKFLWGLFLFIFFYIIAQILSKLYIDYEWFKINNGMNVFWTLFLTKFNVHGIFSLLFIILFILNFLFIRIIGGKGRIFTKKILDRILFSLGGSTKRALFLIIAIGIIAIGFIMGLSASTYWKECLIYINSVPFSGYPNDPIFNKDIGFYIFSLPFYKFLYNWVMISLAIIFTFSTIFHIFNGGIVFNNHKADFSLLSRAHLSTILSIIIFIFGVGYRIAAYEILLSQRGKFFGAGYTAVNAELIAYNVCMIISFIASALLIYNIFKRSFKLPIIVISTIIPVYILLGTIYPSIQQRFIVEPNELDLEKPYITNNIQFTQIAYNLNQIKEKKFANKLNLTHKEIRKNMNTLNNIRLWDWRPLKQTYKQLQELKPYYNFHDVDVDRYIINNNKIAVNLSPRELAISKLNRNSMTWINKHLIYTHGYGMVMSRVNKVTSEGLPQMLIYDIPPRSDFPIDIKQPELYYGEHSNPYVVTNTSITPGEFDYPFGSSNRYTKYDGQGGVKLDSFLKKILFSIGFKDLNILISKYINSESKILFRRNIIEMIKTLSPFLLIDPDPYMVLVNGRALWIIDAYTTSNKFPYSKPLNTSFGEINYIKNSVKIVIDAYDGDMTYYITDENDPIITTYSNIFKGLFNKMSDMPEDIKSHIRYPETIFNIQSNILLRYHMANANVFYNNEDLWEIPIQIYENNEEPIHSYYMVTTLPGESSSEFIIIMPFTPKRKDNMIAFLIARCDPPHYGEIKLYTLPKDKLNYGPMQIEARIDQDAEISKHFTLWGQKGSKVIRGNMLVIPIEESLLFIEPIYLKAEKSEMPELKRVIIAFSDNIIMEKDLEAALEKLFFEGQSFDRQDVSTTKKIDEKLKKYINKAYFHFIKSEKHLKDGNWARYGEEIKKLKKLLKIMKNL